MRKFKHVALLIVSITCGLIAALLVDYYIRTSLSPKKASLKSILVSSQSIELGESLSEKNVTFSQWPIAELPSDYFESRNAVASYVATARIPKGVPITKSSLSLKDAALANQIPKNHRAISIPITDGLPEFIEVGSYIDVIGIFDQKSKNPISKTILQNVRVLQITDKAKEKYNKKEEMITLLVRNDQVESISLAMARATLRFALRNQGDTSAIMSSGVGADELIFGRNTSTQGDGITSPKALPIPKVTSVEVIRGVEKEKETLSN